ncbi:unnamed protein product [Sphagnum jensenii]|uniref:Uncharacterized protein n=1 Tax=Sphagnum jensenii TaxID=128206 RepID=A0ABP1AFJ8_9BRYO
MVQNISDIRLENGVREFCHGSRFRGLRGREDSREEPSSWICERHRGADSTTAAMAPSCWDRHAIRSEWSRGSEQSPLNP